MTTDAPGTHWAWASSGLTGGYRQAEGSDQPEVVELLAPPAPPIVRGGVLLPVLEASRRPAATPPAEPVLTLNSERTRADAAPALAGLLSGVLAGTAIRLSRSEIVQSPALPSFLESVARILRSGLAEGEPAQATLGKPTVGGAEQGSVLALIAVLGSSKSLRDRRAAREQLVNLGPSGIRPLLSAATDCPRDEIIRDIGSTLAGIADRPGGLESLATHMESAPPSARLAVAHALGVAATPATRNRRVELLSTMLHDADADVRDATVMALVRIGGPSARILLASALEKESQPAFRAALGEALAEFDGE